MSDVTVGIYSFMSHACLARAIMSIRTRYGSYDLPFVAVRNCNVVGEV